MYSFLDHRRSTTLSATILAHRCSYVVHVPLDRLTVIALRTMSSHVGQLRRCTWCKREGVCRSDHPREWRVRSPDALWSIRDVGLLCSSCDDYGDPPHARYLQRLSGGKLPRTSMAIIAAYMYPVYAAAIIGPGRLLVDVRGG
jgi:hypothetical protein